MIIDPAFVSSLETNMRVLFTERYAALNKFMWWDTFCFENPSKSLREVVYFALESAKLFPGGAGGFKNFNEIRYLSTYAENTYTQNGLQLTEAELSDLDGNGVKAAAKWVSETAKLVAHHPQQLLADAILSNAVTYDGLAFFHAAHFLNGVDATDGTFANTYTSANYRIDSAVGLDVAATNLAAAIGVIRSLKGPTGLPRNLTPRAIVVPPALWARAVQLTQGLYLPGASSNGGTADNRALMSNLGLGVPVNAPELGASFTGGSDTTYYIVVEWEGEDSAFVYNNRQPFAVTYNSGMTDAELARADKLQWTCKGRNSMMPLHPFCAFRFVAA